MWIAKLKISISFTHEHNNEGMNLLSLSLLITDGEARLPSLSELHPFTVHPSCPILLIYATTSVIYALKC